MRSLLIIFISGLISLTALAQDDVGKLLNFIENNGIDKVSEVDKDEPSKNPKTLMQISSDLAFTNSHTDLINFKKISFQEKDVQKLVREIIKNDLVERFDESYQFIQEACFFLEDDQIKEQENCDAIFEIYDKFNDELNTALEDAEVAKEIQDTNYGGTMEDLFGISLDGDQITHATTAADDPHHELKVEADTTPNKNSVLLRGHVVKSDENPKQTFAEAICQIEQREKLNLSQSLLDEVLLLLEAGLVDFDTPLIEKQKIFCTLMTYYEDIGDFDKIIEFLYLNMPEGDNFCNNNN